MICPGEGRSRRYTSLGDIGGDVWLMADNLVGIPGPGGEWANAPARWRPSGMASAGIAVMSPSCSRIEGSRFWPLVSDRGEAKPCIGGSDPGDRRSPWWIGDRPCCRGEYMAFGLWGGGADMVAARS